MHRLLHFHFILCSVFLLFLCVCVLVCSTFIIFHTHHHPMAEQKKNKIASPPHLIYHFFYIYELGDMILKMCLQNIVVSSCTGLFFSLSTSPSCWWSNELNIITRYQKWRKWFMIHTYIQTRKKLQAIRIHYCLHNIITMLLVRLFVAIPRVFFYAPFSF